MKYFVMYSYRLCKSGLHKQSPSEYQCAKPQGERERKELNVMISCWLKQNAQKKGLPFSLTPNSQALWDLVCWYLLWFILG